MTWDIVSRRKQRTDVMIVVGDPNKGQQFLELLGTHAGLENEVYENICQRMLAGDANAPLKIMFLSSPQKMAIRFEHIRTFSAFALGEAIRKWARDFETLEPSRDIVSPLSPSRAVDVLGRRWAGSSSEVSTETLRKIERLISAPGDLLWVDEKRAPIMASLILNGLNVFAWCISGDLRHKGLKSARLKSEIREITSLLTFAARRAGWVCSMPRASYELGKALAIGDVLHAAYQKARNNELPNGKLAGAAELWQARKYPARVCDRMVKRLRPASRWASRLLYEKRKLSKVEAIAVAANARLRQFFGEERFQVGVFPENRVEHETMLFLGFQADVLYSTAT
jgi:hypothetical protein